MFTRIVNADRRRQVAPTMVKHTSGNSVHYEPPISHIIPYQKVRERSWLSSSSSSSSTSSSSLLSLLWHRWS